MPQFSAPPKPHQSPRKHAPGKTRTRWSNCTHQFNPIRTNRYNTLDTKSSDMNKIDIVQPTLKEPVNALTTHALTANIKLHTPPQDLQIGQVRIGMEKRQKQGSRSH